MLNDIKEALGKGDLTRVGDLLEKHKNHYAADALYFLYEGSYFALTNKLDLAASSFEKCIALDEHFVAAHKNLAAIRHQQGDKRAKDLLLTSSWLDNSDKQTFKFLSEYAFSYSKADIVFYTGTPWVEPQFSPDSLQKALGGSETAYIMMAKELARVGKKVICFCNTPERKIYENIEYIPVVEFFLYNQLFEIPLFISSRFLHPFFKGVKAKKKILWLHDPYRAVDDYDIKPVYHEIDNIFVLSDYHQKTVMDHYQIPADKFLKTRNGFIEENFSILIAKKDKFSLIYTSRPERGLKEALEIFKEVKTEIPNALLHVCLYTNTEKMEDDEFLKPLIQLLKTEGVRFHGRLSKKDLAKLLESCALMLYPNTNDSETSCIAAIESMAAGTPVVASNRGALPETVSNTGAIVPYRADHSFIVEMATEVVSLLIDSERKMALSNEAFNRAREYYRWETIANEWINLFV